MAVRLLALHADLALISRKIPGTHFCYRLSKPQSHSAAGRIKYIKKKTMTSLGIETCNRRLVA
jgi:hypothetical protein